MLTANPTIQAKIEGTVSGQIAVGNHILQIGNIHGGIVNVMVPASQLAAEPRARPISLKPRPFPSMLDRENETATIQSALEFLSSASLFGRGGTGKTALLRRVAYMPETKGRIWGLSTF
jgi:hypothetical protein